MTRGGRVKIHRTYEVETKEVGEIMANNRSLLRKKEASSSA